MPRSQPLHRDDGGALVTPHIARLTNLAKSEDCLISVTDTGVWIRVGRGTLTCERHVTTHAEMRRVIAQHT